MWKYLHITHANGYIEEINKNKYLIFDSIDENKELLKKYNNVFNGIMDKIKEVSTDDGKITWKLNLIQMMTYH